MNVLASIVTLGRFLRQYTGFGFSAVSEEERRLKEFREELENLRGTLSGIVCPDKSRIAAGCLGFFCCVRKILLLCNKNGDLVHLLVGEPVLPHHMHFLEYFPVLHNEVKEIWGHPWNKCSTPEVEPTGGLIWPSMVLPTYAGKMEPKELSLETWNLFPFSGEDKKHFDDTVSGMYLIKAKYLLHLVRSLLQ